MIKVQYSNNRMPRKRVNKSPPAEKRSEDVDDDDFFFDDTQSNSGKLF